MSIIPLPERLQNLEKLYNKDLPELRDNEMTTYHVIPIEELHGENASGPPPLFEAQTLADVCPSDQKITLNLDVEKVQVNRKSMFWKYKMA